MSKITLNFFGEKILVEKNKIKNLPSLRNEISRLFLLSPQDAAEIILTYNENGDKIILENEEDLKIFLDAKIKTIDLDISQSSQIYKDSLNQIKEENKKDKTKLEELLKKKDELLKLKETKFAKEKKEIEEIQKKILELKDKKDTLKKKVKKGMQQIEKKIKENNKKIEEFEKKTGIKAECKKGILKKTIPNQNKMMELSEKYKLKNPKQTRFPTIPKEPSIKLGAKEQFGEFGIEKEGKSLTISWNSYINAQSFDVYRAESRYSEYKKIATVKDTSFKDDSPNSDKYKNFYKIAAAGSKQLSQAVSLETDMFGENMYIFSPSDDIEEIYNIVNTIYKKQGAVNGEGDATTGQQFGSGRYTLAFKTGDYSKMKADNFDMSYYMQIIGLGKVPSDVKLKNIHVPAVLPNNNVTCNFWMNVENFEIPPETVYGSNDVWFQFLWSVSQAAPARRLLVDRPAMLDWWYGWASGGYIADSSFKAEVGSYPQQQYYIRNCKLSKNFYGVNWNFVAQGVQGITAEDTYNLESGLGKSNWKSGKAYTILDNTDVIREKPFLFFDEGEKEYKVFAPALRTKSTGISWASNIGEGTILDISKFYIARADRDNANTINKALSEGKHIILSPGIYYAEEPIQVNKENTIVLGLGLATIIPSDKNKDAAMKVADVGGVTIAGIIFDAQYNSDNMLVVGGKGSNKDHSSNPTILQDIFVRIGGVHPGVASTHQAVVINSNNVIGDDFWLWRADHGDGVGWDLNTAENGLVVNGDDVTLYGLMVEHFQEYDIIWRGENGRTYFLQNEKCYDPQNQNDWKSHEGKALGFAAYKVCNSVKNHYAVGLGSYDVFINTNGASIHLDNAYEVPDTPGVKIENACIVEIANGEGPLVGFNHIINGSGPAISTGIGGKGYGRQALISYCNTKSICLDDYYKHGGNESGVINEETGKQTSDDPKAEQDIDKDDKGDDDDHGDGRTINVLEGKTIKASSENGANVAKNAIDSNLESRWESQHGLDDPEWLQVDLGAVYIVSGFKILWEAASAKEYKIQVSTDGTNWDDVVEVKDGKGVESREETFDAVSAKFIRLYCTKKVLELYGYSVFNFEVMGTKKASKMILKNTISNKIVHRIKCNGCGKYPIIGSRFKCAVCEGFDYCEECEHKLSEKHNHPFLKIYEPKMAPVFFKCQTKK